MERINNVKNKVVSSASKGKNIIKKAQKVKLVDEFKTFIARGNVLDLAVGVIIGAAFQGLVTSLTDNLISPILGCFTEVDFTEYVLHIGNLNLKYGAFITDVINFVIMAFVVFMLVKVMNKFLVKEEAVEEEVKETVVSEDILLLTEIRDLLKNK